MLFFTLRSLDRGCLTNAAWETRQEPLRLPDIMLSITTFKREDAVRSTVARFEAYMAQSPVAEHLHLAVVDNGQSAGIEASEHVTPIANENLGGSGGFARGLIEAERRGATHCLFMDDDASIHMAALERVWSFLAYAKDERTALAGGITMGLHRWVLWESGATFDRVCRPRFLGTDLRDLDEVLKMEFESTLDTPPNFYGGWWFFAFPVAHARYRPFPFFVRGDDVSFSLANDFNIVTLPGLLCFQDADFSEKESLHTLYLDLRSHLAHHLALPALDIGRLATIKMAARFFARSFVQFHYESCAALTLALEDAVRGPAFFAENADMVARRADIAALRNNETWRDGEVPAMSQQSLKPMSRPKLWLMLFTLNGHLLPFFGALGGRRVLRSNERGELHKIWGARQITYVNAQKQVFTVRHSKPAALRQTLKFLRAAARFAGRYERVKQDWRRGYAELASDSFWQRRLGLSGAVSSRTRALPLSA